MSDYMYLSYQLWSIYIHKNEQENAKEEATINRVLNGVVAVASLDPSVIGLLLVYNNCLGQTALVKA